MSLKRNNGGFTLVEFVVTIAVASMITLAATSMLLLGLRIHHTSNATAGQLNTVSMLYSVMDTIASENNVTVDNTDNPKWIITAEGTNIEFDGNNTISLHGTAFVSNVKTSNVVIENSNLLTINISTEHDNYSFSIYCRKGVEPAGP